MANYTIRVELKGNPTFFEYQRLHQAMANLGFYQTVHGVTALGHNQSWNLPHALYYGASLENIVAVRDNVVRAARAIQSGIIVFVAQTETWGIANYE